MLTDFLGTFLPIILLFRAAVELTCVYLTGCWYLHMRCLQYTL